MKLAERPPNGPSGPVVLLLVGLVTAVWSSSWFVIKLGLRDLPPLSGAAIRFALSGAVMALVVKLFGRFEGGARPPVSLILAHGLCQFAGNYGLVYFGETVLPSGLVSVLWSIFPLLMGLSGHFLAKTERLLAPQWFGLGLGFSGIVWLFATDISAIDARAVRVGLLVLLAPLSVAVSTTLIKHRGAHMSSLILNRDSMFLGALVLLALGAAFERDQPLNLTPRAIGSIVYLALAGTVFTFGVYMWLLRFIPAYRLSLTSYVTPVFALLIGAVLGAEPVGVTTVFGTALVLSGVGLTLFKRTAPAA